MSSEKKHRENKQKETRSPLSARRVLQAQRIQCVSRGFQTASGRTWLLPVLQLRKGQIVVWPGRRRVRFFPASSCRFPQLSFVFYNIPGSFVDFCLSCGSGAAIFRGLFPIHKNRDKKSAPRGKGEPRRLFHPPSRAGRGVPCVVWRRCSARLSHDGQTSPHSFHTARMAARSRPVSSQALSIGQLITGN